MAAEREREMQRARRNDGKPHPTEVLRAEARNALHLIGLGGDGVTHEDEMNARRGRGAGRARYTHILIKNLDCFHRSHHQMSDYYKHQNTTWCMYVS